MSTHPWRFDVADHLAMTTALQALEDTAGRLADVAEADVSTWQEYAVQEARVRELAARLRAEVAHASGTFLRGLTRPPGSW